MSLCVPISLQFQIIRLWYKVCRLSEAIWSYFVNMSFIAYQKNKWHKRRIMVKNIHTDCCIRIYIRIVCQIYIVLAFSPLLSLWLFVPANLIFAHIPDIFLRQWTYLKLLICRMPTNKLRFQLSIVAFVAVWSKCIEIEFHWTFCCWRYLFWSQCYTV